MKVLIPPASAAGESLRPPPRQWREISIVLHRTKRFERAAAANLVIRQHQDTVVAGILALFIGLPMRA
jgi:hypothetical protein